MTKLIMLDVFSGQPNPVWEVEDSMASELLTEDAIEATQTDVTSVLGYRGLKIIDTQHDKNEFKALNENSEANFEEVGRIVRDTEKEQALLEYGLGQDAIDESFLAEILSQRDVLEETLGKEFGLTPSGCPPCGGGAAPSYDPSYWNNNNTRLLNNNCYNYANNKATNTFAQPGRASGATAQAMQCNKVQPAAQRDGLKAVGSFAASIPGVWYVALVVWPGRDYHWYRQDDNGCWSHKPGSTKARNTDNSGNQITDPKTCDRGPYVNFCSYMTTVPNANIR